MLCVGYLSVNRVLTENVWGSHGLGGGEFEEPSQRSSIIDT